ncbi:MAG: hypothetical protein QM760_16285 [Nibricoccus sp.]
MLKPELRELARRAGLATAEKKDSQGICFIGEVKMNDFLRAYVPDAPGPIVRADDGRVLGEHRGLHFFTLGQRKGIGVPSNTDNKAYVVVANAPPTTHCSSPSTAPPRPPGFLSAKCGCSFRYTWYCPRPSTAPLELEGRVRYRDPRVAIEFLPRHRALP